MFISYGDTCLSGICLDLPNIYLNYMTVYVYLHISGWSGLFSYNRNCAAVIKLVGMCLPPP